MHASRTPPPRITAVEAFAFHRKLDGDAWNPVSRWHERKAPLLRVTDVDGMMGLGEAWSEQAEIGRVFHAAAQLADVLLRGEPLPLAAALDRDWPWAAAASGLDIALADLRARRAGVPLHQSLGAADGRVQVYASGGLYADGKDEHALASEMAGYARLGFDAVKMKVGGLGLPDDLRRVAAVRDAIGPDRTLLVDAVQQLARETAPSWADALAAHGVAAIQAPLPLADVEGMAALQARGPLQVVANEREHRPAGFRALLERRAVGLLQVCPGLAGGITFALASFERANLAGVPVTLQCHATAILQAACFQLGAGRGGIHSVEYHRFHDHLHAWLPESMRRVHDGALMLDDTPGLGIDPALLDRPFQGPGTLRLVFRLGR